MSQLEVQIMGQAYVLASPEGGEDRLLAAVQRVDTAMTQIRDAGKIRARERIAVLAALNLAYELDTVLENRPTPVTASDDTPAPPADEADLSHLLQRLDSVLDEDGRLL